MPTDLLHHFSEDDSITSFVPHVPRTNPTLRPAVWAIDEAHAPLYWFPRDCPRVTVWRRRDDDRTVFESTFCTAASRVHAIEMGWLDRMQSTQLFRYDFDRTVFRPWESASGQWIAEQVAEPLHMSPVGDLIEQHAAAGIELRLVESLRHLAQVAVDDRWDFSIVRLANAHDVD